MVQANEDEANYTDCEREMTAVKFHVADAILENLLDDATQQAHALLTQKEAFHTHADSAPSAAQLVA